MASPSRCHLSWDQVEKDQPCDYQGKVLPKLREQQVKRHWGRDKLDYLRKKKEASVAGGDQQLGKWQKRKVGDGTMRPWYGVYTARQNHQQKVSRLMIFNLRDTLTQASHIGPAEKTRPETQQSQRVVEPRVSRRPWSPYSPGCWNRALGQSSDTLAVMQLPRPVTSLSCSTAPTFTGLLTPTFTLLRFIVYTAGRMSMLKLSLDHVRPLLKLSDGFPGPRCNCSFLCPHQTWGQALVGYPRSLGVLNISSGMLKKNKTKPSITAEGINMHRYKIGQASTLGDLLYAL